MGSEAPGRRLVAAAALLAVVFGARAAEAYCRTSTCSPGEQGARCFPEESRPATDPPPDCGQVLEWRRSCIGFAVHARGSKQVDAETARELLQQSFAVWESADCGGAAPRIRVEDFGTVECGEVEYNQHGGNVNVLVFRDDDWPHEGNVNALALTTVTFDPDTAEIYDADIEVNSFNRVLTTTQTTQDFDLASVLTHEAGHALGLAHAEDRTTDEENQPTMHPFVQAASTSRRSLTADDVAGICAIYPPSEEPVAECNPIPRHGYAPECLTDQAYGDCSLPARGAPARGGPGHGDAMTALLAAAGALIARRRVRSRSR